MTLLKRASAYLSSAWSHMIQLSGIGSHSLLRTIVLAGVAWSNLSTCSQAQTRVIAYWDFNDATRTGQAIDKVNGLVGTLEKGADYTEDAGGRTESPGDRALDFGRLKAGQHVSVKSTRWFNHAAVADQMTVAYWQKLYEVRDSSALWMVSPSNDSISRGLQVHSPWSDHCVYFDTAGCCDENKQRLVYCKLQKFTWKEWHHFAFVKDRDQKAIWVDGELIARGTNTAQIPSDISELLMGTSPDGEYQMKGLLDDFTVIAGAVDSAMIQSLASGHSPMGLIPDSDGDGLSDPWEDRFGLNKHDAGDAHGDPDSDGLDNLAEYRGDTNPNSSDTDGDGLPDGVETATGVWEGPNKTGTNPWLADTDGDGLADRVEDNTALFIDTGHTGTNPLYTDSDGDGFADPIELQLQADPNKRNASPVKAGLPNLLSYWSFDSGTNATGFPDSAHGLAGVPVGSASLSVAGGGHSGSPGDFGLELGADGQQGSLRFGSAGWLKAIANYGEYTLSFWQKFRAGSTGSEVRILTATKSLAVRAFLPDSSPFLAFGPSLCCASSTFIQTDLRVSRPSFDPSQWHNYTFVRSDSGSQIWLDGELMAQGGPGAKPFNTNVLELTIGASSPPVGTLSLSVLDDVALFASPLGESDIKALANGSSPMALAKDSDGDGLIDVWETNHQLNPGDPADALMDADGDGLSNLDEFRNDLDMRNPDTDADGLPDGVETNTGVWLDSRHAGTDPLKPDTDGDGVLDGAETNTGTFIDRDRTGSNPLSKDTDGDGYDDGFELAVGRNPVDPHVGPVQPDPAGLLAFWDFNAVVANRFVIDRERGTPCLLEGGAVLSENASGRSAEDGDRAAYFPPDPGKPLARVTSMYWAKSLGERDAFTIAFWHRALSVKASFALWVNSPTINPAIDLSVPWAERFIHFDTAGCCTPQQRLQFGIDNLVPPLDVLAWHHFAFVKDRDAKQVWVDGKLITTAVGSTPIPTDVDAIILGAQPNGDYAMAGWMDDFAIYSVPLAFDAINQLAQGAAPNEISVRPRETKISYELIGGIVGEIFWASEPGRIYRMESSSDLAHWTGVAPMLLGNGSRMSLRVGVVEPASPTTFYRLRLQ